MVQDTFEHEPGKPLPVMRVYVLFHCVSRDNSFFSFLLLLLFSNIFVLPFYFPLISIFTAIVVDIHECSSTDFANRITIPVHTRC